MKSSSPKIRYFSFAPAEWIDVVLMNDEDAGKVFKEMIKRLSMNEAPQGSREQAMIEMANDFRAKQRERVMKRWHPEETASPPIQEPVPSSRPVQRTPRKTVEPPDIGDIYDFCTANKFPEPFGREWYDFQESKGWNTLKSQWQVALRGFCQKKMNR